MAQDLLLPDQLKAGARAAGAIAARGAPTLTVAFWFLSRGVWTFAVATPDIDMRPTQDIHADIDAAIATLGGVDAFAALGDLILVFAPNDPPAPAAHAALDAPATQTIDGVGCHAALGDVVVYDHRARA